MMNFPANETDRRTVLLDAARSIGPTLRECAVANEELGTVAPPAVRALQESGMLRLKLGYDLGGAQADPMVQMDVLEELAYHDLTSAWVTMVGTTGVSVLGAYLPQKGVDQIFANGIPRGSVQPAPMAEAVAVDGGYSVSGRWRFNSGVKHSEWAAVGARQKLDDGSMRLLIMGIPIKDVTIHENWDVMALQGTGSCDMSVEDYFVSAEFTNNWSFTDPKPLRGGKLYELPWAAYVSNEHAIVVLGAARRALDELINMAKTTRSTMRPSSLDKRQVVHRFIGEAQLKLGAARALLYESYRSAWASVQDGHTLTPIQINEMRSLGTYCTNVAVEIVTQAFRYGGGKALFRPNIFERLLRDVNAAGQHFAVSDQAIEDYGRSLLGLE